MTRLSKEYIGISISQATLRTEDLIEAFLSFLERHEPEAAERIVREYELENVTTDEDIDEYVEANPDDAGFLIEDLFDAIDEIAPEGTVFSAHVGNGSDFGFWSVKDYPEFCGEDEDEDV